MCVFRYMPSVALYALKLDDSICPSIPLSIYLYVHPSMYMYICLLWPYILENYMIVPTQL